jgi:hypothetical protein
VSSVREREHDPCAALITATFLQAPNPKSQEISIFKLEFGSWNLVLDAYYCITISIFEYFGWRPGINLGAVLIATSGKTTRSINAFITALPRDLARASDSE